MKHDSFNLICFNLRFPVLLFTVITTEQNNIDFGILQYSDEN